tara:strand:- start:1225 stop:1713 length:489 start_codon:yes stop_codon:yes gene_type:complete
MWHWLLKLFGQGLKEEEQELTFLSTPDDKISKITSREYRIRMRTLGIISLTYPQTLDSEYFLTSKKELDRIAPNLVYSSDWYMNDIYDCEDYACQAMLDAGRLHGISARLTMGQTELGYHGFVSTLDTDGNLWMLEPNGGFEWAGEWFKQGEHGYIADKVFV